MARYPPKARGSPIALRARGSPTGSPSIYGLARGSLRARGSPTGSPSIYGLARGSLRARGSPRGSPSTYGLAMGSLWARLPIRPPVYLRARYGLATPGLPGGLARATGIPYRVPYRIPPGVYTPRGIYPPGYRGHMHGDACIPRGRIEIHSRKKY
jgi:hypothetical protein